MATDLDTFRTEITTLFTTGYAASGLTLPIAWPKRAFDSSGKPSWIRFNLTLGDEERSSIGSSTNFFTQRGYVVIQYYAPVENSFKDDMDVLAAMKEIFRDKETASTRFLSPILIDGPVEAAPWMLYTVTARFDGTLLA